MTFLQSIAIFISPSFQFNFVRQKAQDFFLFVIVIICFHSHEKKGDEEKKMINKYQQK